MSLSGLAEESNEKKVQALTLCFSHKTLSIVQNLGLSSDEMKDVTTIIDARGVGHLPEISLRPLVKFEM